MKQNNSGQLLLEALTAAPATDGPLTGVLCLQVITAGCNLRCYGCRYRTETVPGTPYPVSKIVEQHRQHPGLPLLITGGEPLLQLPALTLLAEQTLHEARSLLIRTNGSIDIQHLPPEWPLQVEIKTPSSGMSGVNNYENIRTARRRKDALFIRLLSEEDLTWTLQLMQRSKLIQSSRIQIALYGDEACRQKQKTRLNEAGFKGSLIL